MGKEYTRYKIETHNEEETGILVALLSDWGIEGFEEEGQHLLASGLSSQVDESSIDEYLVLEKKIFEKETVPDQNWNAVWESNFEPVQVGDFVGVRAAFHPPMQQVQHEIVITPKMSFGTGHHATTHLVMQLMQQVDFTGSEVYDFGTGTGILAILAERLGARHVLAVDYDDWCIVNATENVEQNSCKHITIEQADAPPATGNYNVVIANINKNIIILHLTQLCSITQPIGKLILSGLLVADEAEVVAASADIGMKHMETVEKNGWIALFFTKPAF